MTSNNKQLNIALISYSGYPEATSTWMHLDNGLALIAQSLIDAGHQVKIYDFQTLDTWQKLFPYSYADQVGRLRKELLELAYEWKEQEPAITRKEKEILSEAFILENDLKNHNERVTMALTDDLINSFLRWKPNVIGFKFWAQKSLKDQLKMASALKQQFPDSLIIGGGPAVELFEENLISEAPFLDILVFCPGEEIIVKVIENFHNKIQLSKIPGVIYKNNDRIIKTEKYYSPLRENRLTTYDSDIYIDYSKKLHNVHVESSRGCNQKCSFCIHPKKSGSLQLKPVEVFINEIELLNKRYGFFSHLADSNPPFKHLVNISKALIKENKQYGFMAFQSLRDLNKNELVWLKKANFDWLWIGLETGSEKINESIAKNRSMSDLTANWEAVKEMDFTVTASIIAPCPHEDEATIQDSLNIIKLFQPDILLIYPPIIQPGTKWLSAEKCLRIADNEVMIKDFIRYGIEWHTGNSVLPMTFLSDNLGFEILYNNKPYKSVFYEHIRIETEMKRIQRAALLRHLVKQKNHQYQFKQFYIKAQLEIGMAITTGYFEKAYQATAEYNKMVASGTLK